MCVFHGHHKMRRFNYPVQQHVFLILLLIISKNKIECPVLDKEAFKFNEERAMVVKKKKLSAKKSAPKKAAKKMAKKSKPVAKNKAKKVLKQAVVKNIVIKAKSTPQLLLDKSVSVASFVRETPQVITKTRSTVQPSVSR